MAPTLVLAGRHDWICPPEFSAEIQTLIPGARLHVFEHSAHAIRADEPEPFLEVLADFLFSPWLISPRHSSLCRARDMAPCHANTN